MVVDRIVEPSRDFYARFAFGNVGRVGEIGRSELVEVLRRLVAVACKTFVDRLTIGAATARIGVVCKAAIIVAFFVLNYISGVVGDDVHIDLHPARVRRIDESLEFFIGAKMRVDAGEISNPVSVVAGALIAFRTLDRLVLENGRKPDRGDAHAFEIIELCREAR